MMALLRIEPAKDAASGKYFVQIYFPADSADPYVTTEPRYQTAAAAEGDFIALLAAAANRPHQA